MALRNHPYISSAVASSMAVESAIRQARSAFLPTAGLNVTSRLADAGTVLATGGNVLQLVTDFGRTRSRVKAAQFRYQAANDNVSNARAQILLSVRRAY